MFIDKEKSAVGTAYRQRKQIVTLLKVYLKLQTMSRTAWKKNEFIFAKNSASWTRLYSLVRNAASFPL